jgi:hypothetical protein
VKVEDAKEKGEKPLKLLQQHAQPLQATDVSSMDACIEDGDTTSNDHPRDSGAPTPFSDVVDPSQPVETTLVSSIAEDGALSLTHGDD